MKLVLDLDGTLCSDTKGSYKKAKPYLDRITLINKAYDNGDIIIIFTARGSTTGINWRELTKKQLKKWGLKYHKLIFNKPSGDLFIDNLGVNANDFFNN
jgi:histidinol phosphatase-like enzyme